MTPLTKRVVRLTLEFERGRRFVVALDPIDGIVIWPHRCRKQSVSVSVRAAYWHAARVRAGIEKQAKKKARAKK